MYRKYQFSKRRLFLKLETADFGVMTNYGCELQGLHSPSSMIFSFKWWFLTYSRKKTIRPKFSNLELFHKDFCHRFQKPSFFNVFSEFNFILNIIFSERRSARSARLARRDQSTFFFEDTGNLQDFSNPNPEDRLGLFNFNPFPAHFQTFFRISILKMIVARIRFKIEKMIPQGFKYKSFNKPH